MALQEPSRIKKVRARGLRAVPGRAAVRRPGPAPPAPAPAAGAGPRGRTRQQPQLAAAPPLNHLPGLAEEERQRTETVPRTALHLHAGAALTPRRRRELQCGNKLSPALVYNNLTATPKGDRISYACALTAFVVKVDSLKRSDPSTSKVNSNDNLPLHQCCYVTLGNNTFLAVTTTAGFDVFDATGGRMTFQFSLQEQPGTSSASFCRGVAAAASEDGSGQLCVGSSEGVVFVLDCDRSGRFKAPVRLAGHTAAITALGSGYHSSSGKSLDQPHVLASADADGRVVVWGAKSAAEYAKGAEHRVESVAVSICCRGDLLLCGCVDGRVNIYSLEKQRILHQLTAHGRWLYAMALHPSKDLFATGSNDSTATVWTLPTEENGGKIEAKHALRWTDAMITGLAFVGKHGEVVVAAAYDFEEVAAWDLKY